MLLPVQHRRCFQLQCAHNKFFQKGSNSPIKYLTVLFRRYLLTLENWQEAGQEVMTFKWNSPVSITIPEWGIFFPFCLLNWCPPLERSTSRKHFPALYCSRPHKTNTGPLELVPSPKPLCTRVSLANTWAARGPRVLGAVSIHILWSTSCLTECPCPWWQGCACESWRPVLWKPTPHYFPSPHVVALRRAFWHLILAGTGLGAGALSVVPSMVSVFCTSLCCGRPVFLSHRTGLPVFRASGFFCGLLGTCCGYWESLSPHLECPMSTGMQSVD